MAVLQKWDDEDVTSALEWLQEQLTANIQLLSSFEKYKKEVLSGSLDWTPMHTSQQVRAPSSCCAWQLCALHVCCLHHWVPMWQQIVCAPSHARPQFPSGRPCHDTSALAQLQLVGPLLQGLL